MSNERQVTYTIKGDPLELLYSEHGEPEYFAFDSMMFVGRGEQGEIVEIAEYNDNLLVLKNNSVWIVYRTGDVRFPYGLRRTNSDRGCAAPRSLVFAQGTAFWYSGDAFVALSGMVSSKICDPLGDWPVRIRNKRNVVGTACQDRIYWAVELEDHNKGYMDTILVYDPRRQMWDIPWKGLRILDMTTALVDGEQTIYTVEYSEHSMYYVNQFHRSLRADLAGTRGFSGSVTSADADSFTDSETDFPVFSLNSSPAAQIVGSRVCITRGTGAGQVRHVLSHSLHTIQVDRAWDVVPDTTSGYTVGAIEAEITGREEHMGIPHDNKRFKHLEMGFLPT